MSREVPRRFQHLQPGRRYRIIREFLDFDGRLHSPGEEWTFLFHGYLPLDDGLSLFVSTDETNEVHYRLQWRRGEQADVLDELGAYIVEVPT